MFLCSGAFLPPSLQQGWEDLGGRTAAQINAARMPPRPPHEPASGPVFAGPAVNIPSGVPGVRAAVLVPAQAGAFRWLPAYVTSGRESEGFLEVAEALLAL